MTTTKQPKKQTESASDTIRKLAAKHGHLTPRIVLAEASKKTSPIHKHFCWDDTRAARNFRLIQASELIRKIKVTYAIGENRSVTIRAFHNVADEPDGSDEPGGRYYVGIEQCMKVESYRDQMIAQCKRDIAAFRSKYSALTEVAGILEAMEKFN